MEESEREGKKKRREEKRKRKKEAEEVCQRKTGVENERQVFQE